MSGIDEAKLLRRRDCEYWRFSCKFVLDPHDSVSSKRRRLTGHHRIMLGRASSADQYTLNPPGHVLRYVHVKCAAVRLANCQAASR